MNVAPTHTPGPADAALYWRRIRDLERSASPATVARELIIVGHLRRIAEIYGRAAR